MNFIAYIAVAFSIICFSSCQAQDKKGDNESQYEIQKSEAQWKKELTQEEYHVLREKGTERAFTGKFNDFKKEGVFTCAGCGNVLFSSETKYNSGSGWPSFYQPVNENAVAEKEDLSLGMVRTEVLCAKCGGHLGHVFEDGPQPTGLRYCVNSVAMDFKEE